MNKKLKVCIVFTLSNLNRKQLIAYISRTKTIHHKTKFIAFTVDNIHA